MFGVKWKSGEEYYDYLSSIVNVDVKKAIDELGLDESEVNEIEPVLIEGYIFDKNVFSKINNRNKWISSAYHSTWVLFSATQVFIYREEFWADENRHNVSNLEYFYRDITAFRTGQESYDIMDKIIKKEYFGENIRQVNVNTFSIIVPGDSFKISADSSVGIDVKVKGMQQLLREKKSV